VMGTHGHTGLQHFLLGSVRKRWCVWLHVLYSSPAGQRPHRQPNTCLRVQR
jgi:hypothetical protein